MSVITYHLSFLKGGSNFRITKHFVLPEAKIPALPLSVVEQQPECNIVSISGLPEQCSNKF